MCGLISEGGKMTAITAAFLALISAALAGIAIVLAWRAKLKPPRRRAVRFMTYAEADALIRRDPRWRIAPEEDHNREFGKVYLERDLDETE
jgi:hypothetical protein